MKITHVHTQIVRLPADEPLAQQMQAAVDAGGRAGGHDASTDQEMTAAGVDVRAAHDASPLPTSPRFESRITGTSG